MTNSFRNSCELADDNPGGLDTLESPANFSSNPGFISPLAGTVPHGTATNTGEPRPVLRGNPARANPPVASTGSDDPGMDGSPVTATSGFGGGG
jgi:hypothetical protein